VLVRIMHAQSVYESPLSFHQNIYLILGNLLNIQLIFLISLITRYIKCTFAPFVCNMASTSASTSTSRKRNVDELGYSVATEIQMTGSNEKAREFASGFYLQHVKRCRPVAEGAAGGGGYEVTLKISDKPNRVLHATVETSTAIPPQKMPNGDFYVPMQLSLYWGRQVDDFSFAVPSVEQIQFDDPEYKTVQYKKIILLPPVEIVEDVSMHMEAKEVCAALKYTGLGAFLRRWIEDKDTNGSCVRGKEKRIRTFVATTASVVSTAGDEEKIIDLYYAQSTAVNFLTDHWCRLSRAMTVTPKDEDNFLHWVLMIDQLEAATYRRQYMQSAWDGFIAFLKMHQPTSVVYTDRNVQLNIAMALMQLSRFVVTKMREMHLISDSSWITIIGSIVKNAAPDDGGLTALDDGICKWWYEQRSSIKALTVY
jgi:hypothetical protein